MVLRPDRDSVSTVSIGSGEDMERDVRSVAGVSTARRKEISLEAKGVRTYDRH